MSLQRSRSFPKTPRPVPARRPVVESPAQPIVESLEDRRMFSVGPAALANGAANDAVFDPATHTLHVVYYDTASRTLKYQGFKDDGTKTGMTTVDGSADVGLYLSMAEDSTGQLHVAYYDAQNGDLKYARRDLAGVWSTQTVDSKNTVGLYPSIAIDPMTTKPVIAYYYKNEGDLRLASLGDSEWVTSLLANADDVGRYACLTFDGDTMGVAYENTTAGSFLYHERVRFTGAFAGEYMSSLTVVDATTQGGGGNISLVYNNGQPAMSYYDARNADLKYAERSSRGKWSPVLVASKNSQGMYGDLAFTFDTNQPAIVYYNKTTDSALLTYRKPTGGWTFETLITGGGRNLTAIDSVAPAGQAPDLFMIYSDTATGGLKVGTF
jgi:hypothetical protein